LATGITSEAVSGLGNSTAAASLGGGASFLAEAVWARADVAVLSAGTSVLLILNCIGRPVASTATVCICFLRLEV